MKIIGGSMNLMEDENQYNIEEKVSFWEKHRYGIGVFTGIGIAIFAVVIILFLAVVAGNSFFIGGKGAMSTKQSPLLDDETAKKLNEIYAYMKMYFYEDVEADELQDDIYKGVVNGLEDPYSSYYTKEEYEELYINISGLYYGIGAGLNQNVKTMEVTVAKVYRGTPAEEAGLLNGDKILMVNDIDATSMELTELVQHIRGEEGTTVYLKVFRESSQEILEFDVVRKNIELPSIEGEMLQDDIGYIQIAEFQSKTAEQFNQMLDELKSQGMKGLIVDLRGNPGGYLSSVVEILDTLLPEALLVYTEDRDGKRDELWSDSRCVDIPLVVLIDENSASASEIFAGAIKDHEYGTLVGTTTFGKGIVQKPFQLSDGDVLKLTISKYFTPDGHYIHDVGIEPDVLQEYEYTGEKDAPYDKAYDMQFQKAVEVMNEKIN